jgi:hypothetical protein
MRPSPFALLAGLLATATIACGSSTETAAADGGATDDAPSFDASAPDAPTAGDAHANGDGPSSDGSPGPHADAAPPIDGAAPPPDAPASTDSSSTSDSSPSADACTPTCGSNTCGPDGCGGTCGTCTGGAWCGGGGTPGQCGSGTAIPPYPGVTPTQIDTGPAVGLHASPDERHVLVQRSVVTSGPNAYSQGALAVVTLSASGASGSATELTSAVPFTNGVPHADFSADSAGLYFIDVSTTPNKLVAAASDGSGAHTLATGIVQSTAVAGNTLVYMLDAADQGGDRPVYAATLPSGAPVQLVAAGSINYPTAEISPTGTAVLVLDESQTVHELVQTATGAATPFGPSGPQSLFGWAFSPDGARLAYWTAANPSGWALRVIKTDGTGDAALAGLTWADPAFSPDSQHVAYTTLDASAHVAQVTVHSFAGAPDLSIPVTTAHFWSALTYSPDGTLLVMSSSDGTLAVAPVAPGASFTVVATGLAGALDLPFPPAAITNAHDYVAAPVSSRVLTVVPTAGGAAHSASVPVDEVAFYEPVASRPGLLAFTSTSVTQEGIPGSVALVATDGTGTATMLPGSVLPAFTAAQAVHLDAFGWVGTDSGGGQVSEPWPWGWLGSEIVYETDRSQVVPGALDVVAATDDGAGTIGVIAPGANEWTVRGGTTPTRVFFSRASENGVWWSPLPQTPGR